MNEYLKKSYFELFFDKLFSEEYVCLKNILKQVVQKKLVSDLLEARKDTLSDKIKKILENKMNINELVFNENVGEAERELSVAEMLSLIYYDLKTHSGKEKGIGDYPSQASRVLAVYETFKEEFKEKHISKQKEMYDLEGYSYNISNTEAELTEDENYLYFSSSVDIKKINSLSDCQKYINEIKKTDKKTLFFRGHSNSNYFIKSSVERSKKLLENESNMYEQMLIKNPREFENITIHLDILKKMQHYGLPTRLLDITQNILIALYFATEVNDDMDGEVIIFSKENIKYTRSDNVTILSSLAFCNHEMKKNILINANEKNNEEVEEFNSAIDLKKLLHEITSEKNFLPEILPSTFSENYFVLPTLDNERITRQSGCFIISALNKEKGADINERRVKIDGKKTIFIVPHSKKGKLRDELDNFGINRSFVYPEISEVATYLKSKY